MGVMFGRNNGGHAQYGTDAGRACLRQARPTEHGRAGLPFDRNQAKVGRQLFGGLKIVAVDDGGQVVADLLPDGGDDGGQVAACLQARVFVDVAVDVLLGLGELFFQGGNGSNDGLAD